MADSTLEREETARRIRTLRKARGLSIQKLAGTVEMSPGYLSEVERGRSAISGEKLVRLAEELGVTTDYLLSGRGEIAMGSGIRIPTGLSEAAKYLDLTYEQTIRLLAGKASLVAARRPNSGDPEWTKERWIDFYNKVKPYL